jgi:hypothetical protein
MKIREQTLSSGRVQRIVSGDGQGVGVEVLEKRVPNANRAAEIGMINREASKPKSS